jgi:hypothetical protein
VLQITEDQVPENTANPRLRPEARAASLRYAASLTPPKTPKDLDRAARNLWRDITASKPTDWWQGEGGLRLLRRFVRISILAEQLHDRLDELGLDHPEAAELTKRLLAVSTTLGLLASKLRLSVQTGIERHSAHRFERGSPVRPWEDPGRLLLGGHAVRKPQ